MRIRATLSALAALTLLVSCGSSEEPAEEASGSGASDGGSDGAFPVTIDHVFGETTIEEEPERVVVLGWSAQDVVYALGVTPVGMPAYAYGGDDEGVLPWNADLYDPEQTTLIDTTDGYPLEEIASLAPDVILAPYDGFEESVYDSLTGIAPTVAYPDEAWATPWEDQTRIIGEALGRSDEAQQLIDETNQQIADVAAEHPEFEGVTFSYANLGADSMFVYLASDPRVQLVEGLGLTLDPAVQTLAGTGEQTSFYSTLSLEQAPQITSDVLVAWTAGPADEVTSQPIYAQVPAIARGSAVVVDDPGFVFGASAVSVLSIPWVLDQFVGELSTAVAAAQG
ncbi:iron-siderophore ABC transporter substrate-binding protein [Geodermatophilus sp. SYSU D00691]